TVLALALIAPAVARAGAPPPNIVLFLVDDMGPMDTSVPFMTDDAGKPKRYPLNDFYRTPAMERLAGNGIRFSQFYAMSVCSPSRISIMTGQNAARHGATNWINPDRDNAGPQGAPDWNWQGLKPGDVTLPGLLRENGYRTIHVGKGHFGPRQSTGSDPARLGFDVNIAGAAFGAPGSYYAEAHYGAKDKPNRRSHAVPHLEKYHGTEVFLTEVLTREANGAVKEAVSSGKPFFLHMSHYAVHSPFESDPRFAENYKASGKAPPAQNYATLIEGMDKSLGDILDHLEAHGIAGNTLVILLGDNGSDAPLGHQHEVSSSAPLRGKKGSHYEGGMRVPFIAAWAKADPANPHQKSLPIPAGRIQTQVADITDLLPTLAALTGTTPPADHPVDGKPLQILLTGKPDPARAETFLMHYPHGPHRSNYFTTWRDGDWKVIHHYLPQSKTHGGFLQSAGKRYQLFNLKTDPSEQTDLAEKEPARLRRMMEGLIKQTEAHHARYPIAKDGQTRLAPELP
ncbi:MAG TPA: sulfatase, partial [Luteolibacter sp.]|nr:sulfatase [Luteolibacter sp.]